MKKISKEGICTNISKNKNSLVLGNIIVSTLVLFATILSLTLYSCGNSNEVATFSIEADTSYNWCNDNHIIQRNSLPIKYYNIDSVFTLKMTKYDGTVYINTQYGLSWVEYYILNKNVLIRTLADSLPNNTNIKSKVTITWAFYDNNNFLLYKYNDIFMPPLSSSFPRKRYKHRKLYEIQKKVKMDEYIFDNIKYAEIDISMEE